MRGKSMWHLIENMDGWADANEIEFHGIKSKF